MFAVSRFSNGSLLLPCQPIMPSSLIRRFELRFWSRWRVRACGLVGWLAMALLPVSALGVDPMRTALIVNSRSADSLTIANHYVQLREIPEIGIVVLDTVPDATAIDIDSFRDSVLKPLLETLNRRGPGFHTDVVAYSAGFPTAIRFDSDVPKDVELGRVFTKVGSLNGLTALYRYVFSGQPLYARPRTNFYARVETAQLLSNPFIGPDRELWEQANRQASVGEFDTAIATSEQLLGKHPAQWPLAWQRAGWLASAGRPEEAFAAVRLLAERAPIDQRMFAETNAYASLAEQAEFKAVLAGLPETVPERMPPLPFSSETTYGVNGLPVGEGNEGVNLLLSTCLAVTHPGRGNTLEEAVEMLRRAAAADGSGGPAEFYFSASDDVRAKTRQPLVPTAALLLRELGHTVVVDREPLPRGKENLMGAMLGSAAYDWKSRGNTILPGGIVENLTSTSGVLHQPDGQTPMTDLIRGGAAGTSGTVAEPFALQFKFPTPLLHVYYAEGCTLAEAFHLAVESPYQLLTIGDPLCRPYGDQHTEAFSLAQNDVGDATMVTPQFWRGAGARARIRHFEIFIDGKLTNIAPSTIATFQMKHSELTLGCHDLRIVAVSKHPLGISTFQRIVICKGIADETPTATAEVKSLGPDTGNSLLAITVTAPRASKVAIRHLGRRLSEAFGDRATLEVSTSQTGLGPVKLTPEALVDDAWVVGRSITIDPEAARAP